MKNQFTKFLSTSVVALAVMSYSASAENSDQKPSADQKQSDIVEVAFVLDTTGSMAELIEGSKRKIWAIANTIVDINPNADIRMALVAYRDIGDDYVIKHHEMTSDIQGIYGNLVALRAEGGGDTPESVNEALDAAVDQLTWTDGKNVRRIVFLVGDAPPHMDYHNGPKYPMVLKQAKRDDITVHAVQAGLSNETKRIWKDIAQRGGGNYIPIPQDGGRVNDIQTPYDEPIVQLQHRLDQTIVPYGSRKIQAELEQKLEEKSSGSVAKQVDNSAFYSKRTGRKEIVTGKGDIITAIRNEDIALDDVRNENLPDNMKTMTSGEQEVYVGDLIKERMEIEAQMLDLVKKRDNFIQDAEKITANPEEMSFDQAVRSAL